MSGSAWVLVALGAGSGAVARYLVDRALSERGGSFPVGTLVINLTGSLLLGFLTGIAAPHLALVAAGTGLCGGYTTFSTWAYETQQLSERGALAEAGLNVGLTLVGALLAAAAGLALGNVLR